MRNAPRGEEAKRVGIWIRVSTEDQARGESPEHHEARARMYAETKGWTVAEKYDLSGVSGKSVIQHPEAQRMLRDIQSGRITALIFSKLARLARNTRELLEFADAFKTASADLISLHEMIDTSTPAGRHFYTMMAANAEWEREEIADRVKASVAIRAKLGKRIGGVAPFGYRYVDKELVPDPTEAPILRRMYELFLQHGRIRTVARLLNEAGHRMRSGAEFSYTTVRRLLSDTTPAGRHRLNYGKSLGPSKRWVLKPETEWSFVPVEPIVSDEVWRRAQALIAEREAKKKPAKRARRLFAGFVVCHCGQKMYVPSNTPKYVCLKCRNKIPMEDLERVFHSQLRDFFFSPEDIAKHLQAADEVIKEKAALLASMESERDKLTTEADKLYRLYIDDRLTAESFERKHRPLEERLQQLNDEIPRLQGEIDFLKINYLSSSEVIAEAQDLYSRWPSLDFEDKRRIIENITERVVIGDGDISLELCYLPSSEVMAKEQRTL